MFGNMVVMLSIEERLMMAGVVDRSGGWASVRLFHKARRRWSISPDRLHIS
jgi:hypothetical protein